MKGVYWPENPAEIVKEKRFTTEYLKQLLVKLGRTPLSKATLKDLIAQVNDTKVNIVDFSEVLRQHPAPPQKKCHFSHVEKENCEYAIRCYERKCRDAKRLDTLNKAFSQAFPKEKLPEVLSSLQFMYSVVKEPVIWGVWPEDGWPQKYCEHRGEMDRVYFKLGDEMKDRNTAVYRTIEKRKGGRFKICLDHELRCGDYPCSVLRLHPTLDVDDRLMFSVVSGDFKYFLCLTSWTPEHGFEQWKEGPEQYYDVRDVEWENPLFSLKRKTVSAPVNPEEAEPDDDDDNTPITELHKRHKTEAKASTA